MKLKLCVRKLWNDYTCRYSLLIILAFSFLYFILPYFLQGIVGDDFYLYSNCQSSTFIYALYFFLLILILFKIIIRNVKKYENISCWPPQKKYAKFIYWLNVLYLCVVILNGLSLRASGATRGALLEAISGQLFPGYGYLFLLSIVIITHLKNNRYLYLFVFICFIVDMIYQGKIFTMYASVVVMFYIDNLRVKINLKRILIIALLGFSFLFIIYTIRAVASGGNVLVDVYSMFSEFMGVNATSGWGMSYYKSGLPFQLSEFDSVLQDYYIQNVGHGLGLSPVAYFLANFGSGWSFFLSTSIYIFIVMIIYLIGSRVLGKYVLLIFLYNFVHLLRHGPNLFLSKSLLQILFLSVIVLLLYNIGLSQLESHRVK